MTIYSKHKTRKEKGLQQKITAAGKVKTNLKQRNVSKNLNGNSVKVMRIKQIKR